MKGFNIIGRALDKWNAEPSDGAPLPSRDKRKPAAMMLATSLQRQSGCPDDLTTWHMGAPARQEALGVSYRRGRRGGRLADGRPVRILNTAEPPARSRCPHCGDLRDLAD